MNAQTEAVNIRLLERDYTIGVTPGERASLLQAARLLEEQLQQLRGDNRIAPMERIAVLAALNLAHELQRLREDTAQERQRLEKMLDSLERRLARLDGG